MQLRFRTSFQSQVELATVRDNLFHDRLHLVYLDGVDDIVLAFVVILFGSFLETAPRFFNAIVENVREAQQHRGCDVAQHQFVHHFAQVNLRTVLAGRHKDIALFVDSEVAGSPAIDVVKLF